MHAIRLHEFGPAENLRYEEVPTPEPIAGQVRIAVEAAGVHLVDTTIRQGRDGGPFPLPELPMTPGREVAGTIDAVGAGVDPALVGRRAVAHLGQASGGYAEAAVVAETSIHLLADHVDPASAVAMIGTGRTTFGILEQSDLTADDVVLVTAAAGGIGSLLIQAARRAGATVAGVAGGPEKVALVRELGADVSVDYTQGDWVDQVRRELGGAGVTLAFDSVGGDVGIELLDLLAPGARIRVYGWSSTDDGGGAPAELLEARGVTSAVVLGTPMFERPGGLRGLEELALAAVTDGDLAPVINPPIALEDAAEAHRALVGRRTVGKVVLVPEPA